jgi:hypothetical protein
MVISHVRRSKVLSVDQICHNSSSKVIAVAGHKQVLEDGPDIDTPESEQEEDGEVLSGMCTSDMLDDKGRPVLRCSSMAFLEESEVPLVWKCSRTVLLYKKGQEYEIKNWRPIWITSCVYRLYTAMITQWIQNHHCVN